MLLWSLVQHLLARLPDPDRDDGFSTAELLANAALAVGAVVAIWGVLRGVGLDVVEQIRQQLLSGA